MKLYLLALLIAIQSMTGYGQSEPRQDVRIRGGTDNTAIGNTSDKLKVDATGTVAVTQSTSPWVTSRNWTLSSGTDSIAAVQSGAWSAGRTWTLATGTDSLTVGSSVLPTGAATEATLAKLPVAQASTTSGESGPLVQGAVTTAAPTYTTATTDPLSLTTAGALRTDSSGTTQPVSGTIAATQSGTWTVQPGNTANTTAWKVDGSAVTQPISAAALPLPTGASTAANQVTANTSLSSIVTNTNALNLAQGSTTSGQTGALTLGAVTTAAPAYTTGQSSPLSLTTGGLLRVDALISTSATVNQGTAAAASGAWPVKLTDGTNTTAVKAASTAALASDPSAVVALSPNSALPTGSNNVGSITNVTGTVSLPTGAATSALQTTINSTLSNIDAGIPAALGQTTMSASMPVVVASDQSAIPVTVSGVATAANQTTEIASLQVIDNIVHTNNAAFVDGSPIMGQLDDTSTGTVTEDNVATVRITAAKGLHTNLRNNAGTEIGTSSTPVRTDPTGTTTQPIAASDSVKTTYTAVFTNIVIAATPTDVFTIAGSGTKTVKIRKIILSSFASNAAAYSMLMIKRSALDTGGTSTTATNVPRDSGDAAATATVKSYTANPSALGTAVGTTLADRLFTGTVGPGGGGTLAGGSVPYNFDGALEEPPTLRGTAENLAINLNSTTTTGLAMTLTVVWTEQ